MWCVFVSYHTTKMREGMVVRTTKEKKPSRITKPKLPSSSSTGSEWENREENNSGGVNKTSRVGEIRKRAIKQQRRSAESKMNS